MLEVFLKTYIDFNSTNIRVLGVWVCLGVVL
jgi:hypothetical protein